MLDFISANACLLLTSDTEWPYCILIESEALLQCMSSHGLVKDVASSEIENTAIVLILRY